MHLAPSVPPSRIWSENCGRRGYQTRRFFWRATAGAVPLFPPEPRFPPDCPKRVQSEESPFPEFCDSSWVPQAPPWWWRYWDRYSSYFKFCHGCAWYASCRWDSSLWVRITLSKYYKIACFSKMISISSKKSIIAGCCRWGLLRAGIRGTGTTAGTLSFGCRRRSARSFGTLGCGREGCCRLIGSLFARRWGRFLGGWFRHAALRISCKGPIGYCRDGDCRTVRVSSASRSCCRLLCCWACGALA